MKNIFKKIWKDPVLKGAGTMIVAGAIGTIANGKFDSKSIASGAAGGLLGYMTTRPKRESKEEPKDAKRENIDDL